MIVCTFLQIVSQYYFCNVEEYSTMSSFKGVQRYIRVTMIIYVLGILQRKGEGVSILVFTMLLTEWACW